MNNDISIKINKIFKTPHEIINGLMFVTHLKRDTGALFCMPENKIHKFWMKNTYVSLDVIFMDKNFRVVGFSEKTTPLDLSLVYVMRPSKFIIEINSGFVKQNNLRIGDLIKPVYLTTQHLRVAAQTKKTRKSKIRTKTKTHKNLNVKYKFK
jgi:uncharacterized membrane protein (UPF0127 family)